MAKKRVLEFISFAGIGGTERMLLEFLRHISHDKYKLYVCVLLQPGVVNEEASRLHIENISLNMRGYWDFRVWWTFYQFAKQKQIDLIRTYGLKADIIGRIVGKLLGIPANITSVRSTDPWRKWYHVFLDYLTSGFTDLYLSNSEAGAAMVHRREGIPHSKILTIYNGVALAVFDPDASEAQGTPYTYKQMFGIAQTDRVIGIVATLNTIKEHKTIVDALPRIQEHIPEIRCMFVGRDDLHGEIQRYVRKKQLEDTIIFTGCRRDIPQILSMFEVFLLPSLWEGLPMSILEAMAMKKPVIATSVGGIPELVDHKRTGLLIPPNDPEALSDAVIFLLSNPAIAVNMGLAGYERVQQEFSIQTVVTKTETVYDQLIERTFATHNTKDSVNRRQECC